MRACTWLQLRSILEKVQHSEPKPGLSNFWAVRGPHALWSTGPWAACPPGTPPLDRQTILTLALCSNMGSPAPLLDVHTFTFPGHARCLTPPSPAVWSMQAAQTPLWVSFHCISPPLGMGGGRSWRRKRESLETPAVVAAETMWGVVARWESHINLSWATWRQNVIQPHLYLGP